MSSVALADDAPAVGSTAGAAGTPGPAPRSAPAAPTPFAKLEARPPLLSRGSRAALEAEPGGRTADLVDSDCDPLPVHPTRRPEHEGLPAPLMNLRTLAAYRRIDPRRQDMARGTPG